MISIKDIIKKLENMPEFLKPSDLIELGLFPSMQSLYNCRYRGTGPKFIKDGSKFLYPRDKVIEFLTTNINEYTRKKRLNKITGTSFYDVENTIRNLEWKFARYGESDGSKTINDYDNEY